MSIWSVAPLTIGSGGLSIGGSGTIVEWLVVMRRLDESDTLEHAIQTNRLEQWQLDRLASTLDSFLSASRPGAASPASHLQDWRASLAYNQRVLHDPRLRCRPDCSTARPQFSADFCADAAPCWCSAYGVARSSTGTATCAPSTSGSAIRSGSSTAWSSMHDCAPSIRSTRSRSSAWNASAWAPLGRPFHPAAGIARLARRPVRDAVHVLSLPPRDAARAPGDRSPAGGRAHARRRNGRGWPAPICGSQPPMPFGWSARSDHEQVGQGVPFVQPPNRFGEQRRRRATGRSSRAPAPAPSRNGGTASVTRNARSRGRRRPRPPPA